MGRNVVPHFFMDYAVYNFISTCTLCPKKSIPDIFDCNLKTNYQILIIFWCEYS